jgi:hypothetical protein
MSRNGEHVILVLEDGTHCTADVDDVSLASLTGRELVVFKALTEHVAARLSNELTQRSAPSFLLPRLTEPENRNDQ